MAKWLCRKWSVAGLIAGAALGVGLWLGLRGPAVRDDPSAPPPRSVSPFLNTAADVAYVGAEACRSCHSSADHSHRRTGMGRSMAELDPAQEPADQAFDHPPSKRRYEVRRKDGKLWHRELLLTGGPAEVVLAEHPVRYVIGSGNHVRMYAVEAEGFLVESPVSWYTSRQDWGLAPGYDKPDQVGFGRPIPEACLYCHAGQAEAEGRSLHRMRIAEAAIGCERCHGPGALHVARHAPERPAELSENSIDYTIVNPAHLTRDLADAVCQQCHLQTRASVVTRGKKLSDFRPGLPLEDFRQEYWLDAPNQPMRIVGHFEQMHLSRCYQASPTFACATCHDPHDKPRPQKVNLFYNAICIDCHRPETCTVSAPRRQQESPDNSCIHCHMPKAPTEVPHVALTHHRVGIHDEPGAQRRPSKAAPSIPAADTEQLVPWHDLGRLSALDRQRSLGLGYLDWADWSKQPAQTADFRERALGLLSAAHTAGLRDTMLDVGLTRAHLALGLDVLEPAQRALLHPDLTGQGRCLVLHVSARALARQGRVQEAIAALREVTTLRRHAADWLALADCHRTLGDTPAAMAALTAAARIDPRLWEVHHDLAEYHRRQGNPERAAWHQQRAVR